MTLTYSVLAVIGLILVLKVLIKPDQEPRKIYPWVSIVPVCITVSEVIEGTADVLIVYHDYGHGGWQFYTGSDLGDGEPKVIEKTELMKIDPTLQEITDLEVGYKAERKIKGGQWIRSKFLEG